MTDHKMGEKVLSEINHKGDDGKLVKVIDLAQNAWGQAKPEVHNQKLEPGGQPELPKGDKHQENKHQGDRTAHHEHDQKHLQELSHKIKLLNNELHKPGGPLAKSDLELVGFDKSGRLLLIHRDHSGHVDGKFLVDGDSGKIVGRTKPGHLDQWEHGPDYEKAGSKLAPEAKTQKTAIAQTADSKTSKPQIARPDEF